MRKLVLKATFKVLMSLAGMWIFASCRADGTPGPSFDCSKAHSQVNRLICATPELAAIDRKLGDDFNNTKYQAGIDAKALQSSENQWLRQVRNSCADVACLRRAYAARDAAILDQSLRAASPAAYAETRPFPVDPPAWAEAQSYLGKPCENGEDLPAAAGYAPIPGYLPVIGSDAVVVLRGKGGAAFAFLLDTRNSGCHVADVVTLPPRQSADTLLQCHVPADQGSSAPQSTGFGIRRTGQSKLIAYWEVRGEDAKLLRQPLDLLGWSQAIRCVQPETGE